MLVIPLEESIDMCVSTLFANTERVKGLSKLEFKELFPFATKESYFVMEGSTRKLMESP